MKLGVSEMRNGNLAKYPYGIGVSPNEEYEGKDALLPRHPAQGEMSSSSAPVSKHTRQVGSSPSVGTPPEAAGPGGVPRPAAASVSPSSFDAGEAMAGGAGGGEPVLAYTRWGTVALMPSPEPTGLRVSNV